MKNKKLLSSTCFLISGFVLGFGLYVTATESSNPVATSLAEIEKDFTLFDSAETTIKSEPISDGKTSGDVLTAKEFNRVLELLGTGGSGSGGGSNIVESAPIAAQEDGIHTFAHNLAKVPVLFGCKAVNKVAESGFEVGDTVILDSQVDGSHSSNWGRPTTCWADDTNVYFRSTGSLGYFVGEIAEPNHAPSYDKDGDIGLKTNNWDIVLWYGQATGSSGGSGSGTSTGDTMYEGYPDAIVCDGTNSYIAVGPVTGNFWYASVQAGGANRYIDPSTKAITAGLTTGDCKNGTTITELYANNQAFNFVGGGSGAGGGSAKCRLRYRWHDETETNVSSPWQYTPWSTDGSTWQDGTWSGVQNSNSGSCSGNDGCKMQVGIQCEGSGGTGSGGNSGTYSSGWVNTDGTTTVANHTELSFNHNLGTEDLITAVYVADDVNGTNARDITSSGWRRNGESYGAQIQDVTNTDLIVRLGDRGYLEFVDNSYSAPNIDFTGKYIKVVAK